MQMDNISIGKLFSIAGRMHHLYIKTKLAEAGLDEISNPHLLFLIYQSQVEDKQITQKSIADTLGVSAAAIAISLRRMANNGLIEKSTAEDDNRFRYVKLSEKGLAMISQCKNLAKNADHNLFTDFSEADQQQFCQYLSRIIANLHKAGVTAPANFCGGKVND